MKEAKRPINANGLFSGTPPWSKTAPLKRPIKRSMINSEGALLEGAFWALPIYHEDRIFTPTPIPDFLSKDFPSAIRSRMEILTKENLVGTKTAPTASSKPTRIRTAPFE